MKEFAIEYKQTIYHETIIKAKSEKKAIKKFKEALPFEEIDSINELISFKNEEKSNA